MPARAEKLVQLAWATLLTAIDAPACLDCRDGSRAGRGAWDAVGALPVDRPYGRYGYLGDAEVQGCFEHMDHPWLLALLRVRLDARAFLPLRRQWLQAGSLDTEGQGGPPETGTPHGGTGSPVLAQVSLHDALALGFEQGVHPRYRGAALVCR